MRDDFENNYTAEALRKMLVDRRSDVPKTKEHMIDYFCALLKNTQCTVGRGYGEEGGCPAEGEYCYKNICVPRHLSEGAFEDGTPVNINDDFHRDTEDAAPLSDLEQLQINRIKDELSRLTTGIRPDVQSAAVDAVAECLGLGHRQ